MNKSEPEVKKNGNIKIYAEFPENWIEEQRANDLAFFLGTIKDNVINRTLDKMVNKLVEQTKLPRIKIDKKKLTQLVMEKLATRVLENNHEN